jgi:hypothetical protein
MTIFQQHFFNNHINIYHEVGVINTCQTAKFIIYLQNKFSIKEH